MQPLPEWPRPSSSIYNISVQEVSDWIYNLGRFCLWNKEDCEKYKELVRKNKINGSIITNFGLEDLKNHLGIQILGHKLRILQAVKLLKQQEEHVMERFHKQCGMDSLSHTLVPSSSNGRVPSLAPKSQFARRRKKKSPRNVDRRNGRSSDGTFARHSDGYGCHRKGRAILQRGKTIKHNRRVLSEGSCVTKKSLSSFGRRTPSSMSFMDEFPLSNETKDEKQGASSPVSSIKSGEKLNSSSDNKMTRCRKSWVVEKPAEKPREQILISSSSEAPLEGGSHGKTNNHSSLSTSSTCENKHKLGYSIEKQTEDIEGKKGLIPRPSPRRPNRKYKVTSRVTLWNKKSLESTILVYLQRGAVVTVNQLEKRRARIVEVKEDGVAVRRVEGWVSTHEDDRQLLIPWSQQVE